MGRKAYIVLILILLAAGTSFYLFRIRPSPSNRMEALHSLVSADRIEAQLKKLADRPHRAGTEANRAVGNSIIERLRKAGLEVRTEEFHANLPEPVEISLSLTSPSVEELPIHEKVFQEDPYSRIASEDMPFFAHSPDADVEGEVVYVRYGEREDYEQLERMGIDFEGKVVLARAQGICRGMKQLIAEEKKAVAMLLYPELKDQGFRKPSFPGGTHLNPWTIQRGSVLKWFQYPGDPELAPVSTLPRIPSLPVSQIAAEKIFERLGGASAPPKWKGWQPVSYNIGPGPARVRLRLKFQPKQRTLRNIFASLDSSSTGQPYIIAGNHYDAWVYGASDASSGTAVLLETAEALSELKKRGWKPNRTILFAFWDAEEYGFYGSTKNVQDNLANIRSYVALYLNLDSAFRSRDLIANVQPGLRTTVSDCLSKITDPQSGRLYSEIAGEFNLPGYSNDAAPFLNLAGVPVAEFGFGRHYGVYHSVYDNLTWMNLADPEYKYHAVLSQILSSVLFEFATNDVIPYRFTEIADYIRNNVDLRSLDATIQKAYEHFRKAAESYDGMSRKNISPNKAMKLNRLLLTAVTAFSGPDRLPFPERNLLQGPSQTEGCAAQPVPIRTERLAKALLESSAKLEAARKLLQ